VEVIEVVDREVLVEVVGVVVETKTVVVVVLVVVVVPPGHRSGCGWQRSVISSRSVPAFAWILHRPALVP